MTGLLDRELYPNNLLDRVQNLERRLKDLERLAGRPGTDPGQLAYYQADGSLYPGAPGLPLYAKYVRSTAQSIPNATATIVDFSGQWNDTHNAVTTGAAWKFTAPIAGFYVVAAKILFATTATWAANETAALELYRNGAAYGGGNVFDWQSSIDTSGGARPRGLGGVLGLAMNAGDYIDVRVLQSSGGALNLEANALHNHVTIFRIG